MRSILIPGVIAGVVLGLAFVVLNALGTGLSYGAQEIAGLVLMLVAAAAAQVVALRARPLGADAGFPARYFAAMLAALATAVIYGAIAWLYFAVLDRDYLARFYQGYLERARELALAEGGSEQLVADAERMKDFILDPVSQALVQFGTVLMIGLLTGVVVAALVRPRR